MPIEYSTPTRGKSYYFENLSKSAEEPDHPRGMDMMIKLPWNRGVRPNRPKPMVNLRLMELETATDHRGNLPRQALGRDGDDPDEAGGEELLWYILIKHLYARSASFPDHPTMIILN